MRSIETRLTALEKEVAKTELVETAFKDGTTAELDLLEAVRLLLAGKVRTITAPWKPGEREKYMSEKVLALEVFMETWHDKNVKAQQLVTELFDCLESGNMPPDELIKTGREALVEVI